MPNIAIKDDGNPVVSYMQYLLNWMEPKQMVNISVNFGDTFMGSVEGSFLAPGEPCDCCKSSLVCSGNDVFLLFRNNDNNARNSYISKSLDGGFSFTATADMDDYNWMLNSCPATTPRGILFQDSLFVIKRSGATGNNEIVYSNVNKIDLNYSYNRNIDFINGIIQDYPEVTGNEDTIIVVWQDNREGIQDCYISFSLGGVLNFSESFAFTDTISGGQKMDPDVEYANGEIHLVYLNSSQHKIVYVNAAFDELSNIIEINNMRFNQNNVVKIDLLGREIINGNNKPFLYIHDDGTVEKKIIIE
jgi:hypothetical protein